MNDLGQGPIKLVDGQLRDDLSRLWCGCGQPAVHQVPDEATHHRFQCAKCSEGWEAQLQTMSNEELNRKLTELMGYSVKPSSVNPRRYNMVNPQGQEFGLVMPTEGLVWNEYAFPYCTDPAASLEVEKAAIDISPTEYVKNLCSIKWGGKQQMGGVGLNYLAISRLLTATPRQRAEAAYITLSQVNER